MGWKLENHRQITTKMLKKKYRNFYFEKYLEEKYYNIHLFIHFFFIRISRPKYFCAFVTAIFHFCVPEILEMAIRDIVTPKIWTTKTEISTLGLFKYFRTSIKIYTSKKTTSGLPSHFIIRVLFILAKYVQQVP